LESIIASKTAGKKIVIVVGAGHSFALQDSEPKDAGKWEPAL
jgi:hypothetical protein